MPEELLEVLPTEPAVGETALADLAMTNELLADTNVILLALLFTVVVIACAFIWKSLIGR